MRTDGFSAAPVEEEGEGGGGGIASPMMAEGGLDVGEEIGSRDRVEAMIQGLDNWLLGAGPSAIEG